MQYTETGKKYMEEKNRLPLVSVIMPCYNHGGYVGNAIESILNQTYPNIELIVADNGCTDNSFEVINQYRKRIKILRLGKNDRMLCGKMLCEAVTGEYIAQATADDEWMPEKIELQMEAFFSIPNLQVCFTWALQADENMCINAGQENNLFLVKNRSRGEWLRLFFYEGNCLCYPSALYRTDVAEYFGKISRGYAQLGDFYQWISAVQRGEIYVVERPMVKFRWHISGSNANESAPTMGNAIRSGLEYVDIVLQIAENTGDELLREAFGRDFINRNAQTRQELLCERFFLLKRRTEAAPVFSAAIFNFYYNHYLEMERILQKQYGFSFNHYRELAEQCGITYAYTMLGLTQATSKIQVDDLYAYRQMTQKLVEECCPEGIDKRKAGIIFAWMPGSEQDALTRLYQVCKSVLDWISRYSQSLDAFYFEFMKLIERACCLMNDTKEQLKLLGILQDEEEFELFRQLVNLGETEKIDLSEAIVPFIQIMVDRMSEIIDDRKLR